MNYRKVNEELAARLFWEKHPWELNSHQGTWSEMGECQAKYRREAAKLLNG